MKNQKGRIVPQKTVNGRQVVKLEDEHGNSKNFDVAYLVAKTFVPNPDNKPFVSHKNGNKMDNRAENLEWVDGKENFSKNE